MLSATPSVRQPDAAARDDRARAARTGGCRDDQGPEEYERGKEERAGSANVWCAHCRLPLPAPSRPVPARDAAKAGRRHAQDVRNGRGGEAQHRARGAVLATAAGRSRGDPWLCVPASRRVCPFDRWADRIGCRTPVYEARAIATRGRSPGSVPPIVPGCGRMYRDDWVKSRQRAVSPQHVVAPGTVYTPQNHLPERPPWDEETAR